MKTQRTARWVGLLLAGGLLAAGVARAVAPEVSDQGKFFGAVAVKKANEKILDVARKFDRDVLVETFETPPGVDVERVKEMSVKERDEFFREWVKKRCDERAVHGIYVLISRAPRYLYVVEIDANKHIRSGPRIAGAVVTRMREALMEQFREGHFDDGLTGFVQHVEEAFAGAAKER